MSDTSPLALITGASRGLGAALAHTLSQKGWRLILTARGAEELHAIAGRLPHATAIPGDVTDPAHRAELRRAVEAHGQLDALVLNASTLGASPQPGLVAYEAGVLARIFDVNVVGPLALVAQLAAFLPEGGRVVGLSSDAAVEAYAGWGGYGASKAALDHALRVLAAEHPAWRVVSVDPGDMRTQMHAEAFPDEDLSHLPGPETSVPGLLHLLTQDVASGRYHARAEEIAS